MAIMHINPHLSNNDLVATIENGDLAERFNLCSGQVAPSEVSKSVLELKFGKTNISLGDASEIGLELFKETFSDRLRNVLTISKNGSCGNMVNIMSNVEEYSEGKDFSITGLREAGCIISFVAIEISASDEIYNLIGELVFPSHFQSKSSSKLLAIDEAVSKMSSKSNIYTIMTILLVVSFLMSYVGIRAVVSAILE